MSPIQQSHIDFAHEIDFSGILTNPILDIAARCWEEDRYAAFKVCYRSMRVIDNLVDDRRASGRQLTSHEQAQIAGMIRDWLVGLKQGRRDDPFQEQMLDVIERFRLPLWPWERLADAMIYDLSHNGFASFTTFLRYTEGAAIAPASVFMHLCGARPDTDRYRPPEYNIRRAARLLAVFSYLVHIMRDFDKDQRQGLNYFSADILAENNLTVEDLPELARKDEPTPELRSLIGTYHRIAEYYRARARLVMDSLLPALEPRYQLSWELIYQLYLQIYERVEPQHGLFTGAALNPPQDEIMARIQQTIERFERS